MLLAVIRTHSIFGHSDRHDVRSLALPLLRWRILHGFDELRASPATGTLQRDICQNVTAPPKRSKLYQVSLTITDVSSGAVPWSRCATVFDEGAPGKAALVEDLSIRFEDAVRQPVFTHELPDILDRPLGTSVRWNNRAGRPSRPNFIVQRRPVNRVKGK